jgi:MHS family shikimate/dehydroshikimate transporter-like MFS transporter
MTSSKADQDEQVTRRGRRSIRTVAAASSIGTGLEFYDFFIYGTSAALVFGTVFFPRFSSATGTLAAFATFAVGFVARPLGAILFGHLGDRVGRKPILLVTLSLTGAATFAIGLLPGYASIGIWAPILLVTMRILQGIGLGWGGRRWSAAHRRARAARAPRLLRVLGIGVPTDLVSAGHRDGAVARQSAGS